MSAINKSLLWSSVLLTVAFSSYLQAGIVISGTRIVYPAQEREVTVRLENKSQAPLLVQSWIDAGDANSSPEDSDVPFIIMPPVTRIEPSKTQTLRIAFTPETAQAKDRETLYWINILEVPPQNKDGGNHLSIAYRNRLKVFFRPPSLSGSPMEAIDQVSWRLQGDKLFGNNPTPYHVNYASVELIGYGIASSKSSEGGMITPFSEQVFSVKRSGSTGAAPQKVKVEAINDYGAFVERTTALKN